MYLFNNSTKCKFSKKKLCKKRKPKLNDLYRYSSINLKSFKINEKSITKNLNITGNIVNSNQKIKKINIFRNNSIIFSYFMTSIDKNYGSYRNIKYILDNYNEFIIIKGYNNLYQSNIYISFYKENNEIFCGEFIFLNNFNTSFLETSALDSENLNLNIFEIYNSTIKNIYI